MDETVAAPPRRRRTAAALVGAGLAGGLVLAGLNVATAQSPSPSTSPDPNGPRKMHGRHGGKHLGMPRGALHGEFTVPDPDGSGYRTMAMQRGEATAVSATSITVRSEDGFSRTYAVTDDTLVNAGDEGIGDVATGDQVHVLAVVTGGDASAIRVVDATKVGEWRGKWHPRRGPRPSPSG